MYNKINHRSTLALLLAFTTLFLVCPAKSFADVLSVHPPLETKVKTGSESTLPVSITGARDLGALQFEVLFNEDIMEIVNVTRGAGIPPVLLDFNVVRPGLLRVALAGSEPVDGNAKIELRIRGLTAGSGSIAIQEVNAWALTTGFEILTESRPGQVTVSAGLPVLGIWIILIAVALVLLLIAIIAMILRMRKKNARVTYHSNKPPIPNVRPQSPPSFKRFCPGCGQALSANTAFCEQCGEKI